MKIKKKISYLPFLICLVTGLFTSCLKKEFKPVPEGEELVYEPITESLSDALASSPYSLFWEAWQRSHMDSVLNANPKQPITVLIPDNEAFEANGLTLNAIRSAEPAYLDTLLFYHALEGEIDTLSPGPAFGNIYYNTLLLVPGLFDAGNRSTTLNGDPYQHRQYIGSANGELLINGIPCGTLTPISVKNGVLWPINRLLQRPEKHMLEMLLSDDRFSMFLQFLQKFRSDMYNQLTKNGNNVLRRSALLAPTNQSFLEAGISDINSLTAPQGRFLSDSVIVYHQMNNPSLYSNALREEVIRYTDIPLQFEGSGPEKIKVSKQGSDAEPGTITESNINTFEGPLYVIDHLLVPRNYTLN